jgi:beta propeller repeat protein
MTTGKEFIITDTAYDQKNPAIWGKTVVWQDNRYGEWSIFATVLDGPEFAECTAIVEGDINHDCKVDFNDFALMASNWLESHLIE